MALVITRREREGFWVGDAFVRINSVRGNKVKVSIEAPRDIRVRRGELKPFTDPQTDQSDEETSPE